VQVVGVVKDARIDEFTERPWPAVYLPHDRGPAEVVVIASSPRGAADVIREVGAAIRRIDADLPVYDARPLREYVADRLDGERALSALLSLCGGLALGLAGIGLYGIMAYAVACRTHEIGVRMALGAERRDVARLFLGDALRLAAIGVVTGVLPAVAISYAASGMLVGVQPVDAVSLSGAAALLVSATLAAAWLPTTRATRVDPIRALRAE
jgi:putative ABC transport system permease protein